MNTTCKVCGNDGGLWVAMDGKPCMPCISSRQRAATRCGKCQCGKKKIAGTEQGIGSRRWIPCDRCLGAIKQLS